MTQLLVTAEAAPAPVPAGPQGRLSRLISPPRLTGLDAARALAVLGMVGAHVGSIPQFTWDWPLSYLSIVHGNSAVLFAVLAGISIALVTGRDHRPEPHELPRLRLSLVGRGAAIFLFGLGLEMIGVGVALILTFYGVLYIAAIPVLRLQVKSLVLLAAALALLGPITVTTLDVLTLGQHGAGRQLVLTGSYQLTTWAPLMLAGMAVGRLPLSTPRTAARITALGATLAVLATGLGLLLSPVPAWVATVPADEEADDTAMVASAPGLINGGGSLAGEESELSDAICLPALSGSPTELCSRIFEPAPGEGPLVDGWNSYAYYLVEMDPAAAIATSVVSREPHSGATVEIIASGGFALAVIGAMTLIGRRLKWVLLPLSVVGSMPLTAYVAHALVIWVLVGPGGWIASNVVWALMATGIFVFCLAWAALVGRGPLERMTAASARWFAGPATEEQPRSAADER